MAWQYSEKTKKLFMDAVQGKSGAHVGTIENADGVGEHGSVACGDALKFEFRVEKNDDPVQDKIVEAKFQTFGCTSAIAASEALCRIIEERSLTPIEALKITNQDIVEYLEGLPTQKIHCSVMGAEALEAAVFDWAEKRGVDMEALGHKRLNVDENEGRLVCSCFGITEPYLRRKIRELSLRTVDEVTGALKAGGACGTCRGDIQDIINDVWENATCSTGVAELDAVVAEAQANAAPTQPATPAQPAATPSSNAAPNAGFAPLATVQVAPDGSVSQAPTYLNANDDAQEKERVRAEYAAASPYQKAKLIEQTLEREVRPVLQRDGGDLEIVDIKDDLVYLSLTGACGNCDAASATLELLVKTALQDRLSPKVQVVQV